MGLLKSISKPKNLFLLLVILSCLAWQLAYATSSLESTVDSPSSSSSSSSTHWELGPLFWTVAIGGLGLLLLFIYYVDSKSSSAYGYTVLRLQVTRMQSIPECELKKRFDQLCQAERKTREMIVVESLVNMKNDLQITTPSTAPFPNSDDHKVTSQDYLVVTILVAFQGGTHSLATIRTTDDVKKEFNSLRDICSFGKAMDVEVFLTP